MLLCSEDSLIAGPLLEMALVGDLCKELFSPQGTCSSASLSEHFVCPGCRKELREMLKGCKAPGDTSKNPKEVSCLSSLPGIFSYIPSVSVKQSKLTVLFFTKGQGGEEKKGRCAGRVWQAGTSSFSQIAKCRLIRLACLGSQPDI